MPPPPLPLLICTASTLYIFCRVEAIAMLHTLSTLFLTSTFFFSKVPPQRVGYSTNFNEFPTHHMNKGFVLSGLYRVLGEGKFGSSPRRFVPQQFCTKLRGPTHATLRKTAYLGQPAPPTHASTPRPFSSRIKNF